MKKYIPKKLSHKITLLLLPFVILTLALINKSASSSEIYAVNPIEVSYEGKSPTDPMFEIFNMLPGDEVEKVFNVKNDGPHSEAVEMVASKTDEDKAFASALDIEIIEVGSSTFIFSGKLQELFDSPPISLGSFSPGVDKSFRVKVKFPAGAGNEYQNAFVVFNIIWRTELPTTELPTECSHLENKIVNTIFGTERVDHINGTHESELIVSFEGNDHIDGGAGDDCIVTNGGNNRVDGGAGHDIIIAGDGNNRIDGGAGNDRIYLGSGNDRASGGAGDDEVYSDGGNDRLFGNSGNDYLDGGDDHDRINGDTGTDTCVNGEVLRTCEL